MDEAADVSDGSLATTTRGYLGILAAAVPMVTVCVITLSVNGAILGMFVSRRGLRRCKNLYFVNLALADFLVGLSMPYKLSRDLHHNWDFGWSCRVFQTVKQSLEYVSFLSIFLLTWDKWSTIHYRVSHRSKVTKQTTIASVVLVWVISFGSVSVPQIWWDRLITSTSLGSSCELTSAENCANTTHSDTIVIDSNNSDNQNSSINIQYQIKRLSTVSKFVTCPEVYHLNVELSIISTSLYYVLPLMVMLVFDISLYLKIKLRKSVEVQRSTSVTDTYYLTLKKVALELPGGCVTASGVDESGNDSLLKNADNKLINKHLAIASRGERRHSSLPTILPIIKGRTSSGRRVSMPESNSGGGCRYVGRKWSGCASVLGNNQNQPANPMANLTPRLHNEDMLHDIVVQQDKQTIQCLCVMLGLFVACWLPHAVVSMINARCWCLYGAPITITSWFYHLDHAIKPFLYGLMYVQFKNVVRQWLLVDRVHAFKMRDTLILKNLQKKVEYEESSRQRSPMPQIKQCQFELPEITPQFELAQKEVGNTAL